jgi:hypothetical protein
MARFSGPFFVIGRLSANDFLTMARATLSDERLTIKSPIRDKATMERVQNIAFSVKLIDFGLGASRNGHVVTLAPLRIGALMAEAGYEATPQGWRGSIPEVEQRIKALAQQRTAAETALAEALLSDDAPAARDAEDKALRDAFNTMRVTGSADGRSLVAFTKDGDVLDASAMTPLQRKAFERMNALHGGRPVTTS